MQNSDHISHKDKSSLISHYIHSSFDISKPKSGIYYAAACNDYLCTNEQQWTMLYVVIFKMYFGSIWKNVKGNM